MKERRRRRRRQPLLRKAGRSARSTRSAPETRPTTGQTRSRHGDGRQAARGCTRRQRARRRRSTAASRDRRRRVPPDPGRPRRTNPGSQPPKGRWPAVRFSGAARAIRRGHAPRCRRRRRTREAWRRAASGPASGQGWLRSERRRDATPCMGDEGSPTRRVANLGPAWRSRRASGSAPPQACCF